MASLTGKQKRHLRGLAHHLDAVVVVGKDGITDAVLEAIRAALLQHELIKVRVPRSAPLDRDEAGAALAERMGVAIAGAVGRILVVYQRHPEEPRIVLPD